MKIIYVLFAIGLLFQGCSNVERKKLDIDGIERAYSAHLPDIKTYPLIIGLHGGGESIRSFEKYAGLTELQESRNSFGLVYLESVDRHWNDGRSELNSSVDDVAFIEEIIKKYSTLGANKFYVVGMSNGGVMAQRVACDLGSSINGIAVVAATQTTYLRDHCKDSTTVMDALFIFGSEDSAFINSGEIVNPIKPSEVRGHHILITPTVDYWQKRNRCIGDLALIETLDEKPDSTVVNHYTAAPCSAKIEYYEVEGGGHRWPSLDAKNLIPKLGKASHEISAGEKIIQFFGL